MKELPIIQNRKIWFIFSGIVVGASIVGLVVFGFHPGIDFVGGTAWQLQFEDESLTVDGVEEFFASSEAQESLGLEDPLRPTVTRELQNKSFIVRIPPINEEEHQILVGLLEEEFGEFEELRFDSIGPAIGRELRDKAVWASILVLLGISLFVAYSFRQVSYPVTSWKYGIVALVTLFHDVAITVGAYVFMGEFFHSEIDSTAVVAFLVVMGFSVNDTIVVFDRIRENLQMVKKKVDFEGIVNTAVNDTITRSLNTSLTLVVVLLALLFFGPASLKFFLIALTIGTVAGTYSSIFVASPLLVHWYNVGKKR